MVFQAETPVMAAPHPPVTIDVIAYAPVAFFHCLHCESIWQHTDVRAKARCEQLETSLPPDLRDQYQQLSDWVRRMDEAQDRKSTRLDSSHGSISYAVFCLKKKKTTYNQRRSQTIARKIN